MQSNEDFLDWRTEFEQRIRGFRNLREDQGIETDLQENAELPDFNPVFYDRAGEPSKINWEGLQNYCRACGYIRHSPAEGIYLLYKFNFKTGYYEKLSMDTFSMNLAVQLKEYYPSLPLGTTFIGRVASEIFPSLRDSTDLCPSSESTLQMMYSSGEMIPFSNGIYSFMTNKLLPRTSYIFIEHPLNVAFNPEALSNPIRQRYLDMMCGDEELFELLFEQLGYAMYARTFIVPTCTILDGAGSNGKSIVTNIITNIVGVRNISSLSMCDMNNAFALAQTEGKLLNLAKDTASGFSANDFATSDVREFIKKSTSGEMHTFNPKNGKLHDGYGPRKFIFATNVTLNFGGMDGGMARRLYTIPFRATFVPDAAVEAEFFMKDAEEWFAMQALISMMCMVRRKMKGREFSTPYLDGCYLSSSVAKCLKAEQMAANDTVLDWISEDLDLDFLDRDEVRKALIGTASLYETYCRFCNESKRTPKTRNSFTTTMKNTYGLTMKRTRRDNERVYVTEGA